MTAIIDYELTQRTRNILKRNALLTWEAVSAHTAKGMGLFSLRNCGLKSIGEIQARLEFHNLPFFVSDGYRNYMDKAFTDIGEDPWERVEKIKKEYLQSY